MSAVAVTRATGPEKVLQMVVDDPATSYTALEAVLAEYRKLAGFDAARVNRRFAEWQLERRTTAAAPAAVAAPPARGPARL